jgi:hypothetical protein
MCVLFLSVVSVALLLPSDPQVKKATDQEAKIWAAISVSEPIFEESEVAKRLQIHFAVVNEGKKVLDPEIRSSKLFVNGKELKDWDFIIANGIRDDRFKALPPADNLSFCYGLGRHFEKPGIYKLHWKGKAFDAPEIVFRVVSKNPN